MVVGGWPLVNWKCIKILFKETGRSCCLSVVCLVYFCLMKWFCISRPEWANKKRTEQDVSLQGTDTWPWFLKPVDSEALLKFLKLVSSCLSNSKFAATTILEEEEEILSFFLVLCPNTYCMWRLRTLWTLYGHRDASIFALQSSRTSIPRKHVVN